MDSLARLTTRALACHTRAPLVAAVGSAARWLHQAAPPTVGSEIPAEVRVVECGPRDGLQNEAKPVPTETKLQLIRSLEEAGLRTIEATAFVSPKWVPQMADHSDVMAALRGGRGAPGVDYLVLTPNLKGFENAAASGATHVAVFPAASEAFSKKNLNASIDDSLQRFEAVTKAASAAGIQVRGYVSCAVGCPYQGAVEPQAAADVARALYDMGCYEVSMGDTIGVGTPASITAMWEATKRQVPVGALAAHMHDTYGQGIANIVASLQAGVATIDAAVAGLGGCPYAKGATGNVATEDVVYTLDGYGIHHGIDTPKLLAASDLICGFLGKRSASRAGAALAAKMASS